MAQIFERTQVETVCNLYGPSETTTYSTWVAMQRGEPFAPHIGRPLANTQIYILDGRGAPVPVGVTGELYIGGAGVARGYLNRAALTAERFVPDPFGAESGRRLYRTGDLGRWRADGTIEFLGRADFQVKIRGFRIELGEIEARLTAHPAIAEAVVVAREDGAGDPRLVAYYTTRASDTDVAGEAEVSAEELREHVAATLPAYMVPAAYVRVDEWPLTPSGKLNRQALPAPGGAAFGVAQYEAPQGETEQMLASIWAELLHVDTVGRHDNFFALGGHSLLAMQVVTRLRQALGVEVAVRDLFAYPVLRDLAARIVNLQLDELDPDVLSNALKLMRFSKVTSEP